MPGQSCVISPASIESSDHDKACDSTSSWVTDKIQYRAKVWSAVGDFGLMSASLARVPSAETLHLVLDGSRFPARANK